MYKRQEPLHNRIRHVSPDRWSRPVHRSSKSPGLTRNQSSLQALGQHQTAARFGPLGPSTNSATNFSRASRESPFAQTSGPLRSPDPQTKEGFTAPWHQLQERSGASRARLPSDTAEELDACAWAPYESASERDGSPTPWVPSDQESDEESDTKIPNTIARLVAILSLIHI